MIGALKVCAVHAAIVFSCAVAAWAAHVVKVSDGDTITVIDAGGNQVRVRLWGIDAPEKAQAFGEASRRQLAAVVAGKDVRLERRGHDRYGRLLAEVYVGDENANLEQVRGGWAWHYAAFARKATAYAEAEKSARERRCGLWADANPVPPWEWRRFNKKKKRSRGTPRGRFFCARARFPRPGRAGRAAFLDARV